LKEQQNNSAIVQRGDVRLITNEGTTNQQHKGITMSNNNGKGEKR
jgi:hypothetical protein